MVFLPARRDETASGVVDYISERVRSAKPYGIRLLDPQEPDVIARSVMRIDQLTTVLKDKLPFPQMEMVERLRTHVREVNPNLDFLPPDEKKEVSRFVNILVHQGYIKASIGDTVVPGHPIFRTNHLFLDYLTKAFERGQTGYSGSTGTPNFKKAVADYTDFRFGFKTEPSDVLVGRGATDPIEKISQSLMQDSYGIAGAPFYPPYESSTHLAGGKLSRIVAKEENGYRLTADEIEVRIKKLVNRGVPLKKIKVLWLTHPNNPTGFFYSEAELGRIAAVARKYNLTVVADEVYGGTVTEGNYTSMLKVWESLPEKRRFPLVHLGGFSKDPLFWFTGARIGWAVIPGKDKRSQALRNTINFTLAPPQLNPPTPLEEAGAELINHYLQNPKQFRAHMGEALKVLDQKNSRLHEVMNAIPQVQRAGGYAKPPSAFYHFVPFDISRTSLSGSRNPDLAFARMLQRRYRLRLTHGGAFYYPPSVKRGSANVIHQRIVSLLPNDLIDEIGIRIRKALGKMESGQRKKSNNQEK